jgi:hypothetical protein
VSHLDTAFKLGAIQAQYDFEAELNKVADLPAGPPIPGVKPGQGPAPKPIGPSGPGSGTHTPKLPTPPVPPLTPRPGMGGGPQ